MKRKKIVISIILITIIFIISFLGFGAILSQKLEVEKISLIIENGVTKISIMHISDLHYPKNEISIDNLIEQIESLQPDLIFLTGDMIDSSTAKKDVEALAPLLDYIGNKSTSFAVLGNHETINASLGIYKNMLREYKIKLLENSFEEITIKNKNITVVGISDNFGYNSKNIPALEDIHTPVFLLAHRPERWKEYLSSSSIPPTITFAGHAHGGQFKFLGKGVYAPSQGFFPKYFDGLYKDNKKYMVVSRGLGNSIIPIRLYNRNHMPFVEVYL